MMELLVHAGANVNKINALGGAPLCSLFEGEQVLTGRMVRCCECLVEHGADLNLRTNPPVLHTVLLMRGCRDLALCMINAVGRDALAVCHMYRRDSPKLPELMIEAWQK
jgi:hypothetical protein